jgi:hypothetical protein
MSYILKALKKLENENAVRETGAVQIKSAILTSYSNSHASPSKSSGWWIILLVFLAGGITAYFILRPANPAIIQRREKNIQPDIPPSQTGVQGAKSRPDDAPVPPAAIIPLERTVSEPIIQERSMEPPPVKSTKNRSMTEQTALPGAATSSLTVNGIAIQDDPAESIAVVNGVIVKQGMTIGGVRVDRIYLNRVRFKGDSGTFEVHLVK